MCTKRLILIISTRALYDSNSCRERKLGMSGVLQYAWVNQTTPFAIKIGWFFRNYGGSWFAFRQSLANLVWPKFTLLQMQQRQLQELSLSCCCCCRRPGSEAQVTCFQPSRSARHRRRITSLLQAARVSHKSSQTKQQHQPKSVLPKKTHIFSPRSIDIQVLGSQTVFT